MKLALIRHTRPVVEAGLCYGRSDVPLAADRDDAAQAVLHRLHDLREAVILTSPARRCQWLAEWLAPRLHARAVISDARLQEMHFGDWEGRLWDDIGMAALDQWAAEPEDFVPPGGESAKMLRHRVEILWDEWLHDRRNRIVVTHGGPLRVLTALAAGRRIDMMAAAPAFGSVTRVQIGNASNTQKAIDPAA